MRILCLGLLQDGGCRGVGVFREEIRVSGECPYAGGVGIRSDTASHNLSTHLATGFDGKGDNPNRN